MALGDPRWAEPFERLKRKVQTARPDCVALAFLEIMQPDLRVRRSVDRRRLPIARIGGIWGRAVMCAKTCRRLSPRSRHGIRQSPLPW